jgi:hypothetical protein
MMKEHTDLEVGLSDSDVLSLVEMLKLNADLREDVPADEVERLESLELDVRAGIIGEAFAEKLLQELPEGSPVAAHWLGSFEQWIEQHRSSGGHDASEEC